MSDHPTEPTSISTDMLKTPEGQSNAVFACVGSALQHAQEFEQALVSFLLALSRLNLAPTSLTEREALAAGLERRTLGQLLRQFRDRVTIDQVKLYELMDVAVEKRNFLAHRFFRERAQLLDSKDGRFQMMRELSQIQGYFEEAAVMTRAMTIALNDTLDGKHTRSQGHAVFTVTIK